MAIIVHTSKPKALLAKLYTLIDEKKIETWQYDEEKDFFHVPDQWQGEGWLRPSIAPGLLIFGLIGRRNVPMKKVIYAVYHGRFIEMLLTHADENFSVVSATAQMENEIDVFKS